MIAVIGTGLSGLTMAAALAHHGFDVMLIGEKPQSKDDKRSTAILAPNIEFLKSIKLWPLGDATPLRRMELVDGNETFAFDCDEMDLPEFGFNIANDALKSALTAKVSKIKWKKAALKKATRDATGWILQLSDKTTVKASLLIGADGRNSAVRAAADIAVREKDRDQAALVVNLTAEKPHNNITVERYRSGGVFTLVPHTQNRFALVWCDEASILKEKIALPPRELATEITRISERRFGKLSCDDAPQIWPLKPMKAQSLVAPRTALIGEAAHVLPPIGAQGFNASLQDIAALTAALMQGKALGLATHDFAMLKQYETAREKDVAARFHGITMLNDLIRAKDGFIRRCVLRGAEKIAPVKKALMQFGLGKAA
jgi:2-octaprenyl-6-methoxyphenol hydroxylase